MPHHPVFNRLLDRLIDLLIRHRGALLLTALIATMAGIPLASRLQLEQSLEAFFSEDDPLLQTWLNSEKWFGNDELLLVAYDVPDKYPSATAPEHLNELREFSNALSEVPGIRADSTQSLETLLRPRFGTSFAQRVVARSFARMRQEDILAFGEHIVISHDGRTTAVVLRLEPESMAGVTRMETFRRVREIAAAHDPPARVAGEPVQVNDMFRYVDQDSKVLGWSSSILLILMILLLFRSLRWVVLPLLVVHATLVWTKSVLVLSGMELSMVSSTLTSLVTIIAIATVTHITVTYREKRLTLDREPALRETMRQLGAPVFWTCLTTAIGFGALLSSSITPVRSFGLMLALAAMLVLVACALILPGGVLFLRRDGDPRPTPAEGRLVRFLHHVSRGVDRHPVAWLVGLTAVMIFTGSGLALLKVETDFSRNFRDRSEIVQALQFFENRLGGVGSWEVDFAFEGDLTDETLQPVRKLAEELRALRLPDGTGLTKVVAITDGIDFAPGSGIEQKIERLKAIQPEFVSSLYNAEAHRMRIVLRALEQQPAEVKLSLIDEVTRTARRTFPDSEPTGFYVLLANLISSLLSDQLESFLLATLGIFVCMTIAFRNIWIGLLSLLPNVFPLLLVIGGMGWTGLPINIGTAMIASVSMGLTVDSSIHYLAGYLRSRRAGATYAEALRATHGSVGVAMVFANFVLAAGFLVLALSNFIPLVYFGSLVSLSMLGGLLGDLVLLPLVLRWVPIAADVPAAETEPDAEAGAIPEPPAASLPGETSAS